MTSRSNPLNLLVNYPHSTGNEPVDYSAWAERSRRWLAHELRVTYRVVARDLTASLIPATLFSLGALRAAGDWSWSGAARVVAGCGAYFFLYIYTFCLCNQIAGYAEDVVNKPDRVLPSKMITMPGAVARFRLAMVAFPIVAYALGGASMALWALLWQGTIVAYNYLGLDRHWFNKNVVFISLGAAVQLAPAWEMAAPLTATAWRWILYVSIAFGVTLNVQDLRDVEGDRESGRLTLPMAVGDRMARLITAAGIGLLPIATHLVLVLDTPWSVTATLAEGALAALNVVVAVRTWRLRTPGADHTTYMLHTGWFCAVLASALVIL